MSRVSLDTLKQRSVQNMGAVHPAVKEKALAMLEQAYNEGINVQISAGLRTRSEQQRLYNQGRTAPGNVVTNAKPGQSIHNYGLAIDFFLTTYDGSKATWTVNSDWRRVAEIGKSLGFHWGGDWTSFKDYPHLELTGGLGWRDLAAGRRPPAHLLQTGKVKSATATAGVLKRGDQGARVKALQLDLLEAGATLAADGIYGEETEEAVKRFQKKNHLDVDGIAGPLTMETLEETIEGGAIMQPTSGTLRETFESFLSRAVKRGQIKKEWLDDYQEGKLTLSDALALKALIDELPNGDTPPDAHETAWKEATAAGLFNGERPNDAITRAETATVLRRFN